MTRALVAALAALALAAAPVPAAEQRTSLADIEDEVMCPVCGTPLALAEDAPQAQRQRAFIQRLVERGHTKEQVKDALVAEYGPEVLATPDDEGFDLAAWLVPGLIILAAAAAIGTAVLRWRRARGRAEAAAAAPPAGTDAARLEADLRRYDL
jgi:cytochrome c-type biogenesis protein CcmH